MWSWQHSRSVWRFSHFAHFASITPLSSLPGVVFRFRSVAWVVARAHQCAEKSPISWARGGVRSKFHITIKIINGTLYRALSGVANQRECDLPLRFANSLFHLLLSVCLYTSIHFAFLLFVLHIYRVYITASILPYTDILADYAIKSTCTHAGIISYNFGFILCEWLWKERRGKYICEHSGFDYSCYYHGYY